MRKLITTSLLASVLLAGCGSSGSGTALHDVPGDSTGETTTTAAASSLDTCTLVTKAEAQAALGETVAAGKAGGAGSVPSCVFSSTEKVGDAVIVQQQKGYVFNGTLSAAGNNTSTFTIERISGLGEDAFVQAPTSTSSGTLGLLTAFSKKGRYIYIGISSRTMSIDDAKAKELELAKKAASRI